MYVIIHAPVLGLVTAVLGSRELKFCMEEQGNKIKWKSDAWLC